MTGPILTKPEIDALLYGETHMTTEQRARESDDITLATAVCKVLGIFDKGIARDHDVQIICKAFRQVRDSAIAAERLACKQLAASYPARQHGYLIRDDPAALAQQVASEIAQAIGARE